ncbi:MAG: hypothetical protein Q8M16_15670 [Pirellulaceae bacterium]|nr:hypothetical protein [Pirellulaceae bacterium]
MKILFLHGWHSVPGGVKPKYLKDHGYEVINPALPDDDFGAAVAIAQADFGSAKNRLIDIRFDACRPEVDSSKSCGNSRSFLAKAIAPRMGHDGRTC